MQAARYPAWRSDKDGSIVCIVIWAGVVVEPGMRPARKALRGRGYRSLVVAHRSTRKGTWKPRAHAASKYLLNHRGGIRNRLSAAHRA